MGVVTFDAPWRVVDYMCACDVAIEEVSSGIYLVIKDGVVGDVYRFLSAKEVLGVLKMDVKVLLCGLQKHTANFSLHKK